jgi:hypothetical protein
MNYISNEKSEYKKEYNTFDDITKPKGNPSNSGNPNNNANDAFLNFIENDSNDKLNKTIRFAVDYCRASPNISLNNKNMLNIGWRIQKFNYDVEYEIVDFKGDKKYVKKVFNPI